MGPRRNADGAGNTPAAKRSRASAPRNAYPRRRAMTACQLYRMRKNSSTDFSSLILDRVNYAIRLIEQNPGSPIVSASDTPRARHVPQQHPEDSASSKLVSRVLLEETGLNNTEYTFLLEAQRLQAQSASSSVVHRPFLRNLRDPSELDKLFFKPDYHNALAQQIISPGGRFLGNVTQNPNFGSDEDGFQWDGPPCLILISCTLGTIARPFSQVRSSPQDNSRTEGRDHTTAESYYTAARKRIGLLDSSIVTIHCGFLIGVSEMHSMRPLRAWLSFSRACTFFQTYLHSSSFSQPLEQLPEAVRSRLYWSYLKPNCEMREEIALPPTELVKVAPDLDDAGQKRPETTLDANSERSWYYYLSEIAKEWTKTPIHHLQRTAEELDAQTIQRAENFPPMVQLNTDDPVTADELSYARYLDLCERIWRPFLYLAAHPGPQVPNLPIYAQYASIWRNLYTKVLLLLVAAEGHNNVMPPEWRAVMDTCIAGLVYWGDEASDLRAARITPQHIYQSVSSNYTDIGKTGRILLLGDTYGN
ncbi:fungal specific transcription factor domain-containing protein [Aspergillus undulatus]|uniref:fungal specific transcription factor domain-containing protein n=1 Tax=Aspergillus undulatus TaxID=1810928 RepID=UPI003CCD0D4D